MLNARFVLISLLLPTLWIHANGWAASNEHIKSQSTEEQLAQAIENGTSKDVEGLRESFARAPDFVERLQRMAELEGET
ncbi:MAG: hypothetical protein P8Y95_17370, partial [Gammaproteobacteria bacterium]